MKKGYKVIAVLMCLMIILSVSACSDYDNKESAVQKTYNTLFKQPSSVIPNTAASETETVSSEEVEETIVTVARKKKRVYYKQDTDMRNITSEQLLQEINIGINLGDSFNGSGIGYGKSIEEYESFAGNPIVTEELIEAYYKAGFKAVRIPVSWTDHIDSDMNIDDTWTENIKMIVDSILNYNMYCIINTQNDQSWLTTAKSGFNLTKQKFEKLWTNIATEFGEYNDRLLFESAGEFLKADNDRSEPSKADLKNANILNGVFVNAVRKTGGNNANRHLIVTTYGSFIDENTLSGFEIPTDTVKNRLIAKVNAYVPSSFCLDGSGNALWGSKEDRQYLLSVLTSVYSRFSQLNIPVIIGEFGVINKGNESPKVAYTQFFIETAYNYYMVCFWYDDGRDFNLINRYDYEIKHERLLKQMIKSAK